MIETSCSESIFKIDSKKKNSKNLFLDFHLEFEPQE